MALNFTPLSHVALLVLLLSNFLFSCCGLRSNTARVFNGKNQYALRSSFMQTMLANSLQQPVGSHNWAFLDDVFLISTYQSNSSDRFERTKQELESVGLWDRVKVRTFQTDDQDRVRGCYTSHLAIMKEIDKVFSNRDSYCVLVLEDNLEVTKGMQSEVIESVASFVEASSDWDVFHLAYMMYVPNLSLLKYRCSSIQGDVDKEWDKRIVQMIAKPGASVGTSSYIVSKSGTKRLLALDRAQGYVEAIPNVMAEIFPDTRYASYPMVFHRAGMFLLCFV